MQLVAPVRGHHQRQVVRAGASSSSPATATASRPSSAPSRSEGAGDRRVAHHEHARRAYHGLEEDLDRPAGQARVLDRHRALLARDLPALGADLGLVAEREDPQQQRLSALDRLQGVGAHAVLRAGAADEALDRPVAEHERDVPGLHARRALRADHGRGHERLAPLGELARPPGHGLRHHCGGSARPCIAAQTRAGVQGMSMCSTP